MPHGLDLSTARDLFPRILGWLGRHGPGRGMGREIHQTELVR